jgi:biopolymer transport protein ExbD
MAVSAFHPSDLRRAQRDVSEINITPLVDVLLVLLVIFMVTAPTLTSRLDMRLPQNTDAATKPPPSMTLRVRSDGLYLLEGRVLARGDLAAALDALARQAPDSVLRISAEDEADYQGFARALAQAQRSGLSNIAME